MLKNIFILTLTAQLICFETYENDTIVNILSKSANVADYVKELTEMIDSVFYKHIDSSDSTRFLEYLNEAIGLKYKEMFKSDDETCDFKLKINQYFDGVQKDIHNIDKIKMKDNLTDKIKKMVLYEFYEEFSDSEFKKTDKDVKVPMKKIKEYIELIVEGYRKLNIEYEKIQFEIYSSEIDNYSTKVKDYLKLIDKPEIAIITSIEKIINTHYIKGTKGERIKTRITSLVNALQMINKRRTAKSLDL